MQDLSNFMGNVFEDITKEYLIRRAKQRQLPFIPYYIDHWWGNNPILKAQDDVDILALDQTKTKAIFIECKFTAKPMPMAEYLDLVTATQSFPNLKEIYLFFVSKSGYTQLVIKQAKVDGATLLTIDDLFQI